HRVRILFDRSRFPQIRQLRPVVALPLLRGAAQLRERDDRQLKFFRKRFQTAGNPGDLLNPVLEASISGHELQIVDDHQTQSLFRSATYAAMFNESAVFPIEGRAAIMTRSPGCRPDVKRSKSVKPVATPVIISRSLYSFSSRRVVGSSNSFTETKPVFVRRSER